MMASSRKPSTGTLSGIASLGSARYASAANTRLRSSSGRLNPTSRDMAISDSTLPMRSAMNGGAWAAWVSSSSFCAAAMIVSALSSLTLACTSRMPLTKNCRSSSLNWMLMSIGMAESSKRAAERGSLPGGRDRVNQASPAAGHRHRASQDSLHARPERGDEARDDGGERQVDLWEVSHRLPAFQEVRIGRRHGLATGLQLIIGGIGPWPEIEDRQAARNVTDGLADVADDGDGMARRDQPRVARRGIAQDRIAHLRCEGRVVDDHARFGVDLVRSRIEIVRADHRDAAIDHQRFRVQADARSGAAGFDRR